MKKTTRNILIMLAVLAVLGGAVAALVLTQPQEGETSSSPTVSTAPAETVTDVESSQVQSISVENRAGGFTMVPGDPSQEESGEDDSPRFVLQGYEEYDVDTDGVTDTALGLLSLTASKSLGEQENLEDFGLAGEDAVAVSIRKNDGGEEKLTVGNLGGESVGRYVLKDGKVYIVSGIDDKVTGDAFAYFDTEVYSVEDRTMDMEDEDGNVTQQQAADRLESASITGTAFPQEIRLEYDESLSSGYLIVEPLKVESGSGKFNDMLTALKSLTADSVAAAGLTEETLEEYGLSEPFAQIEFSYNGEPHTLAVSEKDGDGNRYLTASGKDVVYKVPADSVSTWAETTVMDLRMPYIWLPNIKEVKELTLALEGGKTYSYSASREKNEERSTDAKPFYDLTVKNAGGDGIDYSTCYQPFYQHLIGLSVLSMEEADYGKEPVLRVEYEYFDGEDGDTLEFFPVGQDRYAAELNGQYNGLLRKTDLDKLMALIPDLDAGKEIRKPD